MIRKPISKWYEFVLLKHFTAGWQSLGLSDELLANFQRSLLDDPKDAPVIPGTGGVRKTRLAIHTGQGKSGGARVAYVYFESLGVIALLSIFAKNDQSNLTASQKAILKSAVEGLEKYLRSRERPRKRSNV